MGGISTAIGAIGGALLGGKGNKSKGSSSSETQGTSTSTSASNYGSTSSAATQSGSNSSTQSGSTTNSSTTGQFGSTTGSKGGSFTQQVGTTTSTPYQQEYQRQLLGLAQQQLGNMPAYDPYQEAGWAAIADTAQGQMELTPQVTSVLMDMLKGEPNLQMWSPMMDMARRQITQGFTEDVLPSMATEALQYGGYGGAGYKQNLDIGAGRVAGALADAETQMVFQAMQDAQGQRNTAIQAIPGITGMGYQAGEAMASVGSQRRNQPLNDLSWYKTLLGGDMGSTTTSTSAADSSNWSNANTSGWNTSNTNANTSGWANTNSSGWSNTQGSTSGFNNTTGTSDWSSLTHGSNTQKTPGDPISGALGGAMLGSLFSDRRLKKNIRKVGEINGLNLYAYHYVWGGPEMIGVMADEVEEVYPDAVGEVCGFKFVNYERIF